jgi:hypothetical protein
MGTTRKKMARRGRVERKTEDVRRNVSENRHRDSPCPLLCPLPGVSMLAPFPEGDILAACQTLPGRSLSEP